MRTLTTILVTGGSGFIGSNFIRYMLNEAPGFSGNIINLDALTYAGNPRNLWDVEAAYGKNAAGPVRYTFVRGDITDAPLLAGLFAARRVDTVVNFAAESHVDRSIQDPAVFIKTNITGAYTLLEAARAAWKTKDGQRQDTLFHHVSTDEVYGSIPAPGLFTETTAYAPRSPYSASKAASDHLALAWYNTYGLPLTLSNCSNNFGPCQFPEKFIPLSILNILDRKPLLLYGDGSHVRDWIYVDDHSAALWTIMRKAALGEKYHIGAGNERENRVLLDALISVTAAKASLDPQAVRNTIAHVKDRPGADLRYAMDSSKLESLGWKPQVSFEEGLNRTVDWYLQNPAWTAAIRSGAYREHPAP